MLFRIPPSELVTYIQESLSFSGHHGMVLSEIWESVRYKLQLDVVDNFQKQIIWQWLFFSIDPHHLYIVKDGEPVRISSDYKEFVKTQGTEDELRMIPSPDTQCKYLTGVANSKRIKLQLGENPFELLCEIARYGASGIQAPDLCKATGQDPRSLTPRLKKLEELGYIRKKNVYNDKTRQHTSLCVHSKFAENDIELYSSDLTEDFDSSRNVTKLKQYIIHSLKNAPNKLRGFKDLKKELKLDQGKSSNKFFRGIIEYLHSHGYAEKLMVKDPNQSQLVYCVKYLKDIPKDVDEISDYVELYNEYGSPNKDFEDEECESDIIPSYNLFYPLPNQLYQGIQSTKSQGITSMDLVRFLTGVSDYRPIIKLLDSLTSYVYDNNKPKRIKNYDDLYPDTSIIRAYDFEGKFKFYRYFSVRHHPVSDSIKKETPKVTLSTTDNETLMSLNKKYFSPLSKIPPGAILTSKKRKAAETKLTPKKPKNASENAPKRARGRPRKVDADLAPPEDHSLPVAALTSAPASQDVSELKEDPSGDVTSASKTSSPADESLSNSVLSIDPKLPVSTKMQRKVTPLKTPVHSGSLKAVRRRAELLNIIKEMGGVTYTTAKLCRILDERLGNSTVTDKKTLARDVSLMINSKEIEVQDIKFIRSGQQISRKLLILLDPALRPSDEEIDEVKKQCLVDTGLKNSSQTNKRVIESEVTMYYHQPLKTTQKKSREKRLDSLKSGAGQDTDRTLNVMPIKEEEPAMELDDKQKTADEGDVSSKTNDPLSTLVSGKTTRKRKAAVKKELTRKPPSKRLKNVPKLDKNDVTTLYRAVVISRTFKRGAIDFESIANLFEDMDVESIRAKWTQVRKYVGGLNSVMKGISSFERIVTKGIEDGLISVNDLEQLNYKTFLDLWNDSEGSVLEPVDENPLYVHREDNANEYNFQVMNDHSPTVFDQLEDNSMKQKEFILSNILFSYSDNTAIERKDLEEERTLLKAIFATNEENFSSERVNQLLQEYPDENIRQASLSLIKDKELSYYSDDDSNSKFVLTDKVHNALISKIFRKKFFNQAAFFASNLSGIVEASKGLVLSQGILNGQMAALLHCLSRGTVEISRVDRPYKFIGYESRLIDKEKLACDIVAYGCLSLVGENGIKSIPIPAGKACSHIWLDVHGNINTHMWAKIISSILYYITFRPGVPAHILHSKLHPVLGYDDFHCVLNWLVESKCIKREKYDGFWISNDWFMILGS